MVYQSNPPVQQPLINNTQHTHPMLQSAIPNPAQTPSYNSLGVIEDMLDIPAQLDWVRAPATFLDAYQSPN